MATGSEGIILRDGEKFITDNVSRYRTRSDIFLSSFFFFSPLSRSNLEFKVSSKELDMFDTSIYLIKSNGGSNNVSRRKS